MDAKEQARGIWDKVHEWGTAKIGELSFMEQLAIATEPGKKAALLDEERAYAESLISSALSAQAAEVERLKSDLAFAYSYFAPTTCGPAFGEVYRRLEPYAAPPAAPEPTP